MMAYRTLPVDGIEQAWVDWLSICYIFLFLVGIVGNTSVLTILVYTFRKRNKQSQSPKQQTRTLLSVIALVVVDLYVLFSLPATISDFFMGHWVFGRIVCKLHWIVESSGKFLSIFILMTFSYDRYTTVCHPFSRYRIKTPAVYGVILLILTLISFILHSPLSFYAEITLTEIHVKAVSETIIFTKNRCNLCFTKAMGMAFTGYAFLFGFLLPGSVILFSNLRILCKVHHHITEVESKISYSRVARYTLGVCGFYTICWTPFWITFFLIEFTGVEEELPIGQHIVYVMHVLHSLPYVSSSFNWVFYFLLNKEVQRMRDHANNLETEVRRRYVAAFGARNLTCNLNTDPHNEHLRFLTRSY